MLSTSSFSRVRAALAVGLALALWLPAPPAAATVLTSLDLPTLSASADRVLLGTVEKVESHYLGSDQQYIVTDVTIRSDRNLRGVPEGSRLVVRHLGGVVGELGQRVHGEASYRVGEQLLLFAAARQGSYFAVGMTQGALHLYQDHAGVTRVGRHLEGAQLQGPTASGPRSLDQRPLGEVLAEVESYLGRRPPLPKPTGEGRP